MYRHKDDAASDVIAFILILFLIVSAVAGWMLVIIPDQGYQAESAHNEKVLQEFAKLKMGIDQLWLNQMSGYYNSYLISLSPTERTSLSTLLYLAPTLGSGMIKIEKGTQITMTDTMRYWDSVKKIWRKEEGDPSKINLLRLSYYSDNEYAPNYIITYEGGVVLFSDEKGNSYYLSEPFADKDKDKRFILIAADAEVKPSTLLGNLPVTVKYEYTGHYSATKQDDRTVDGGVLVQNIRRDYIELYGEKDGSGNNTEDALTITAAGDTSTDRTLASYWGGVFKDAKSSNKDTVGSEVQIMFYDLSMTGSGLSS